MRISIQNLGIVKNADIDMRPLTIFVGPNNAGKTWTAYSLAAILGLRGVREYADDYVEGRLELEYPLIDRAVEQLLEKGDARVDMVRFVEDYGNAYLNDFARHCILKMEQLVGAGQAAFDELEIYVDLSSSLSRIVDKLLQFDFKIKLGRLNVLKERGKSYLYFYLETDEEMGDNVPETVIQNLVTTSVFGYIHRGIYADVYVLPTERATFVSMPMYSYADEKQFDESFPKGLSRGDRIPDSIGYFLNVVARALGGNHAHRLERRLSNQRYNKYVNLATVLEKNVLGGDIIIDPQPESDPVIKCQFYPAENISLPMTSASSMVKELTPLVLYLRYLARPNELIIIDEPEMNLHPEAQASLVEFLAMLVNSDLHILVTTHSPYMIDHLVNLMRASEHSDKEEIKDKFFLRDVRAFVPKNAVAVYLFEQGEARSILDEDGLIDWGTFANVSDRISEIFYQL